MDDLNIEDFIAWANENEEDYQEFFNTYLEDVLDDHTPKSFLNWANDDIETAQEVFEEVIYDIILDLEEDDYFGTEGFDKRFS